MKIPTSDYFLVLLDQLYPNIPVEKKVATALKAVNLAGKYENTPWANPIIVLKMAAFEMGAFEA